MKNRRGLVVDARVTKAEGKAEKTAAIDMVSEIPGTHRITLEVDKGYDRADFAAQCRMNQATHHVAQREKGQAIDAGHLT